MKSRNIYIKHRQEQGGFMVLDVVIALSIAGIILSSLLVAVFQNDRFSESIKERTAILSEGSIVGTSYKSENYDEVTHTFKSGNPNYVDISFKNYIFPFLNAKDSYAGLCSPDNAFATVESVSEISMGIGISDEVTDIAVKGNYIIASRDDSNSNSPDIEILEVGAAGELSTISNLDTGPGIVGFDYDQSHVYALRAGTAYQLQVIDISDPIHPSLEIQFRVPLPFATATPPFSRTVTLSNHYLYIGTQKWDGPEFIVVDVGDPNNPIQVGSYEIGSIVNSIVVKGSRAFVASGGQFQFLEFDVGNPSTPILVGSLEFPGWQTQEGKSLAIDGHNIIFGRSVGGFNNIHNHELFVIDTDSMWDAPVDPIAVSFDVGRSIYGMVVGSGTIMTIESGLAQKASRYDLENLGEGPVAITNEAGANIIAGTPTAIWCDDASAYVSTKSPAEIYKINFKGL